MSRILQIAAISLVAIGTQAAMAVSNDLQADYGTVALPFSQGFSNTFTSLGGGNFVDQHGFTVSDSTAITAPVGPTAPGTFATYNFYDDFEFTLPSTSSGSLTASAVSISFANVFGISNLQARLYPVTTGLTTGVPASLVTGWSLPTNAGGTTVTVSTFASPINLTAGTTYTLEIRGDVFGPTGSYGGNLNISAVPEAESWALAVVGLGLLGAVASRRRQK